jgi:hypothetical protein
MQPMKPMKPMAPMVPLKAPARWWPESLGADPNSAGAQNRMRYAFFGEKRRVALDSGDGNVQVYDTGDHVISGVQQGQVGDTRKLVFTSQHGEVKVEELKRV